jgi:hypothetical protein
LHYDRGTGRLTQVDDPDTDTEVEDAETEAEDFDEVL